ncbi:PAS domain S-box-containing protein [Rhodopseudomonas julia]|uniref:Blue-light-activated histidine kinase n=1 Tax=Rhodopseudomonas julia TaxID=200617 RepID=A0ABU0C539_9BRAD|nr:PAS domain-containing protein [Rhodopseudomonas julia]MDQ0325633.1 PAS domain S-box-containing protein [Rhodopseudomonas julia]
MHKENLRSPAADRLEDLKRENAELKARLAALGEGRRPSQADEEDAGARLLRREEQQALVAALSNHALAGAPIDQLLDEAVAGVGKALGCDHTAILRLLPDGENFLLTAGSGWRAGLVGTHLVSARAGSKASFALSSGQPVVTGDIAQEPRFAQDGVFLEHGIKSGVTVLIGKKDNPWGALGVHACEIERFVAEDIGFVQAVANILAVAIERQRAETRLQAQERRLRLALDSAHIGTWVWHKEEGLSYWDETTFEIFGVQERDRPLPHEEAIGFVHPADRERVSRELSALIEDGRPLSIEFRITRPDGEIRWLAAAAECHRSDQGTRAYGVNYDISAPKKAQAELADNAARYRLSLRAVAGVVYERDMTTGLVTASEGLERLVGESHGGNSFLPWWLERVHPDDRDRLRRLDAELQEGERDSFEATYRVRHADGHWIDVWDRAYLIFDKDRRPSRLFGFASDVSELLEVQRRQTVLLAELDHRVKNMLANISAIATQSRSETHSIDSFIRSLRGRIQALADAHELLSRSGWSGTLLRDLVEGALRAVGGRANVRLQIDGPDVMLPPRLTQSLALSLHELAANAARFGALSAPGGHLKITWERDDLRDGHLFTWDETAPEALQPPANEGFGTFVIRSMMETELHEKVRLEFRSQGVLCAFRIPQMKEAPRHDLPAAARGRQNGKPKADPALPKGAVLIVEDSPLLASVMQEAVEAAGWPVVGIAADVAEARRMVAEKTFAVALLDLNLQDEISTEVARDLRRKGVPYVIASAYRPQDLLEPELADAPYLPKPIDQRALVEIVRLLMSSPLERFAPA